MDHVSDFTRFYELFVLGGHDGAHFVRTTLRYDARGNAWRPAAEMRTARSGVGAAALAGPGELYAFESWSLPL